MNRKDNDLKIDYDINDIEVPIIISAIHGGHEIRPDVLEKIAISDMDRLREEDPYTEYFTDLSPNRIVVHTSRFEIDINRRRHESVYRSPEDAWGLDVLKKSLTSEQVSRSLAEYDSFYRNMDAIFQDFFKKHDRIFVLDIHSYNHHRLGKHASFDDPEKNPEIIVGTTAMDPQNMFIADELQNAFKEYQFLGRKLDVRKNIKYPGGSFPRTFNKKYKDKICCIGLEFKKFFMDEWTGEIYQEEYQELKKALKAAVERVRPII